MLGFPCSQVLDEIVQIITEEKFAGKMVVTLAGYEQQVGPHAIAMIWQDCEQLAVFLTRVLSNM
jgi:translation initiation factor 1 (eIF-1/SUI1)